MAASPRPGSVIAKLRQTGLGNVASQDVDYATKTYTPPPINVYSV